MDPFDANLTPSPSPSDQLQNTPTTKKTLQKPTPTKITKRKAVNGATTASPSRATKNSPMPKSKSEIQPHDQLVLELRAANPPTPWKEIETLYREAGGITSGHANLRIRILSLKALDDEMTDAEFAKLVEAEAAVEAEWQKEKWGKVASHLETEGEKTWNAKFLKKTFGERAKNGGRF